MVNINETILGVCSICRGAVVVPTCWHSIIQPVPTCSSCGATKAAGPVIPMVPRRSTKTTTGGTDIVIGDPVRITTTGTDMPERAKFEDVIDPNRKSWW